MNLNTRIRLQLLLALSVMSLAAAAFAQPARLELKNLEKLSDKAEEVNDITLDGPLLQLAAGAVKASHDPEADQIKDVIQGLKGIYVKSFKFEKPNAYTAADVEAIRSQLARPGWSRIVENSNKREASHNEIYLFKDKETDKIAGLAILVAEPTELTVVNIVGFIDIDRLGALAGSFGIPEEVKDKPEKPKTKTPAPTKPDQKEDAHDDQNHDQ